MKKIRIDVVLIVAVENSSNKDSAVSADCFIEQESIQQ